MAIVIQKGIEKYKEDKDQITEDNEQLLVNSRSRSSFVNGNDLICLEVIVAQGPLTRAALVKATGLPRTTVFDTLQRLLLTKLVRQVTKFNGQRGRPNNEFISLIRLTD